MAWCSRSTATLALALLVTLAGHGRVGHAQEDEEPELRLRAGAGVGFAPTDVLFIAELRGGSDDYRPFYCASVEWDWDDDTRSETTLDCDPYEPGVTQIQRRFSTRHHFELGGSYTIRVSLKQRDDVVASARTRIQLSGR